MKSVWISTSFDFASLTILSGVFKGMLNDGDSIRMLKWYKYLQLISLKFSFLLFFLLVKLLIEEGSESSSY